MALLHVTANNELRVSDRSQLSITFDAAKMKKELTAKKHDCAYKNCAHHK